MQKMGIYQIRNTKTGALYIGSSVSCDKRKYKHFSDLNLNRHFNQHLQYSFNKHGKDFFVFEIIEEVLIAELLIEREQSCIDYLSPEYNIRKVASSNLGLKHSNETRKKMSKAQKGRTFSPEGLENIRRAAKNRTYHQTEAMRIASSRVITEYNKSDAHRKIASEMGKINGPKNIRKAHAKRRIPDDIKQQIISDVSNGMMQKDAAIKYGYSKISICRIINNKRFNKSEK
jgi:group I intron endonuclease